MKALVNLILPLAILFGFAPGICAQVTIGAGIAPERGMVVYNVNSNGLFVG